MSNDEASSTRKRAVLVLALVIGAIVVGVLAIRSLATEDAKDKVEGSASATAGEGTTSVVTGSAQGTATRTGSTPPAATGANSVAANGAEHAPGIASGVTSGAPVDITQLLLEAKIVDQARAALAAGDPKQALKELEFYDKIPNASSLKQEATILKIQALLQVGRRTDARALAYSTRDDPSFKTYQSRIEAVLADAG